MSAETMSREDLAAPDAPALTLTAAAFAADARRERSIQTNPGASDIGPCLRRAAFLRHGVAPTDPDEPTMSAVLGSWLHENAHRTMQEAYGTVHEIRVAHPSGILTGHLDTLWLARRHLARARQDKVRDVVTGYDETTLEDLKTKADDRLIDYVRAYGPPESERRQVYTYVWLLSTFGAQVRPKGSTLATRFVRSLGPIQVDRVRLRYLDRSRGEEYVFEEAVDPARIEEAAERFQWVAESDDPTDMPREQRGPGLSYVCDSCPFVTACWGAREPDENGVWPQAIRLVEGETTEAEQAALYREGMVLEKQGKAMKEDARAVLTAVREETEYAGVARVKWTGGNPRGEVEDVEAMRALLLRAKVPIPMKDGGRTARSISVRPPSKT